MLVRMEQALVRITHALVLSAGCAAVALAGCAKHSDTSTTTTTTDTTTSAPADVTSAAPASAAPAAGSMSAGAGEAGSAAATPVPAASGGFAFIDIPVYPGASADKSGHMSLSANGGSMTMDVYSSSAASKTVADWYKSHLPANWQNQIITANDKTVGTFVQEQTGVGDQSVIVGESNGTTRIQITTKHGK